MAEDAKLRFFRLGIPVCAYVDGHQQRMSASTLREGDVALAISNSGQSKPVIGAIEIARSYGATTIALTRPGTPLAEAAEIVIPVAIAEDAQRLHADGLALRAYGCRSTRSPLASPPRWGRVRARRCGVCVITLATIGVAGPSPSSDPAPLMKRLKPRE